MLLRFWFLCFTQASSAASQRAPRGGIAVDLQVLVVAIARSQCDQRSWCTRARRNGVDGFAWRLAPVRGGVTAHAAGHARRHCQPVSRLRACSRKSRPSCGWARAWRRWLCLCCRRVAVATVAAVVSSCTGYERGVTCHTGVSVRACCPFASVAAGVLARCRRLSSPHMSTHEMRHATRVESAKRRDTHVHCVLCCASHRTARRSARQCDAPFTFTSEVCASGHRFVW